MNEEILVGVSDIVVLVSIVIKEIFFEEFKKEIMPKILKKTIAYCIAILAQINLL